MDIKSSYRKQDDPLREGRNLTHLVRTANPRGFHARRLLEQEGYVQIKPEIFEHFKNEGEVNQALEKYLELENTG